MDVKKPLLSGAESAADIRVLKHLGGFCALFGTAVNTAQISLEAEFEIFSP